MSKFGKLRKKFTALVEQFSPNQVREQLILAYLQMEKCQQVLAGCNVEPVSMMDNGESSDLELFYRCKKTAEELAYLNEKVSNPDKSIKYCIEVDYRRAIGEIKKFKEQLDKIGCATRKRNLCGKKFKEMADSMKARVPQIGTEVYFLAKGQIHKSVVTDLVGMEASTGMPICKVKGHDNAFSAGVLYATAEELAQNVGKIVQNHISVSSDHESAYFIDNTSRVFKGAKWYLEDQKIFWYDSLDELRFVLLKTVVDDLKQ